MAMVYAGTDAVLWGRAFWEQFSHFVEDGLDEETMVTWFSTAIEEGRKAGHQAGYAIGVNTERQRIQEAIIKATKEFREVLHGDAEQPSQTQTR